MSQISPSPAKKAKPKDWLFFESDLSQKGFRHIAGVDEVGRGPWAGPVVAAAVIFPPKILLPDINDSKKLNSLQREKLFKQIKKKAVSIGVGIAEVGDINQLNILKASLKAMHQALLNLKISPGFVLVDGREKIPHLKIPQTPIVKGDSKSQSIAAASIIAKVTRDKIMQVLHKQFPEFGFDRHKGYGTKKHQEALKKFGPTPLHRLGYAPVKLSYMKSKEYGLGL
ncbi:MAG: Ribonuclease HII [candidate division Zixibacteria bacterium RBG-1]|nr:MAG: Ribonuclease HII [candidate division Zixibacteria bacterium RBG-1]OGC83768.1 MAG: ribonuclease HII [candidate division Zixibacteria bacterium RBG_19FT_COMBO_42_43]